MCVLICKQTADAGPHIHVIVRYNAIQNAQPCTFIIRTCMTVTDIYTCTTLGTKCK